MSKLNFLILFLFFCACQAPLKTVAPAKDVEPKPTDFLYYNPKYDFDTNSNLQLNGIYFKVLEEDTFGDTYQLFRFYPDGVLIQYVVYTTPDKALELNKVTTRNIHGHYKTQSDSLFFTTRVYYDHTPVFHKGKIFSDSLVINSINYKTKYNETNTYYFYKK